MANITCHKFPSVMKKIIFAFILLCGSAFANAQTAKNPFEKYGFKKVRAYSFSKGEFEEFHDNKEIVEIGSVLYNTKTKKVVGYVKATDKDVSAATPAMSIDPLCEKYLWIFPYAYCMNNPIRFIDPDGLDVYRFDDKTGTFHLMETNDDATDKVMGYHQNKAGDWVQNKGFFQIKTRMDGIEKGILNDGINFKTDNNLIEIGGEGQPTLEGVQSFVVDLSEMVGKEIGGYDIANKGSDSPSYVHIGKYKNNKYNESVKSYYPYRDYSSKLDMNSVYEHTDWHTHPSRASDSDRSQDSERDKKMKLKTQRDHPHVKKFIILTKGFSPISY